MNFGQIGSAGRPFSCTYKTRPAAFCPYPGGLNFGQIGSAPLETAQSLLQFLTAHRDAPTDTPEARGRPLAARDKSFISTEEDKGSFSIAQGTHTATAAQSNSTLKSRDPQSGDVHTVITNRRTAASHTQTEGRAHRCGHVALRMQVSSLRITARGSLWIEIPIAC